jgi:hypothetical protein
MTRANSNSDSSVLSGSGLIERLSGEPPAGPGSVPHHAGGLFNHRWAQNLLPLGTSLLFHLTLLGIGFGLYETVQAIQRPVHEQLIVPESRTIKAPPMIAAMPDHASVMASLSNDSSEAIKLGSVGGKSNDDLVRLSAGTGAPGLNSAAEGPHETTGSRGMGEGGTAPPYGSPDGVRGGRGQFPGFRPGEPRGNASKVVFLCDCSGSMIGVFGEVKAELKRSIDAMPMGRDGTMQFNVIFFSDEGPRMLFKDGLRFATVDNKKIARDFIDDAVASGGTVPLPAIKAALQSNPRPDLIYVLTDGFDNVSSFDEVVDTFKKGTADGKTKVNCYFFQADPDPKLVDVLTEIAKNGHGVMRTVLKSTME